MAKVLVTGATGLVGIAVVDRLIENGERPLILIRGGSPGTARVRRYQQLGLVECVNGDLAAPHLALPLEARSRLRAEVDQVLHIGGHYRLSADFATVNEVNVGGTARLLDLFAGRPLSAFHMVSSIVAAGRADGNVPEALLPKPAAFRNAYEESKWSSEALIAQSGQPARIYRPGIIVGDSSTGETTKFDGPYAAFPLAVPWAPFFIAGSGCNWFPLVTVDLVADVLSAGLNRPPTACEVLNVLDGSRPTLLSFTRAMTQRLAGHQLVLSMPRSLLEAIVGLPGFHRLCELEAEALAYMSASWTFSTEAFDRFCLASGLSNERLATAYDALAVYYCAVRGRRVRLPYPPAPEALLSTI